jgi:hypothetical protein
MLVNPLVQEFCGKMRGRQQIKVTAVLNHIFLLEKNVPVPVSALAHVCTRKRSWTFPPSGKWEAVH